MNPDSTEDRLSSLPKNIIESILICLPLRDAVRTSILAHAWRYNWSNVPQLVFDRLIIPLPKSLLLQIDYDSKLSKIIDQVLLLHQGPIHKFKLSTELRCCMDIDKWILFVSRSGIREFILDKFKGQPYKVPSSLFLCEEITHLELYRCILAPPASFNGFNNLRRLDLQRVGFSNDGLDNLISNCPRLNKLLLGNIVGCTHLKIHSPNLVDLSVNAGAFKDLTFDKTPALAKVSIDWSNEDSQSVENGALCNLASLFGSLPSLNSLKLLGHTLQILSAGDVPVSLPDSCQLSELSVSINFEDMQEVLAILCIFRSSPLLKRVDITSISDKNTARICIEDFWEAHDFNCLFSVLQFINVTAYTGTITELKFMEFVLANAPVLETVKIQLKENISDVLKVYRQLIRIRRISPKVEILIPE